MIIQATELEDAKLIALEPRGDARGMFARTMCAREFAPHGIVTDFVQQNMSVSAQKGTLRGMHRQLAPHEEGKLIRCVRGAIYDVIIDLRPDSSTFKRWQGFELTAANRLQLYAPPGFAHGFLTLCDDCEVTYLVSAYYEPGAESGVRFDDPAFGVEWPFAPSVVSDKDNAWPDYVG